MNGSNDNIRVIIPLTLRRRNGRPNILPPEHIVVEQQRGQDPHILKALGRAWAWRRRIDNAEANTAGEIVKAEGVTERFVGRAMRLAYLSPEVLERLVLLSEPPAISLAEIIDTTYLPWVKQGPS